jgi:NAD(P)-dependent dehydrogenase (short-subunit alcohol dehydrogenase family)
MSTLNKIALVTGSSRGLGKNMALSLSKAGLDVVVTYNSKADEAEKVVQEIKTLGRRAIALQLNVGKIASYDEFAAKLSQQLKANWDTSKIDFLVNNAGIGINRPLAETSEEQFDELMGVHFKGAFFLTQKLLPMLNDKGGIVNISTGLTRFAIPGYGAYASMKGAIETYTKYLAKELGARGIRVNVVAPGAINTDFNKASLEQHPEMRGFISSQTALGRIGEADDIGGVVAFLCTDSARWVNAQRLEASGGMFL